jgi:hypothetical protein
MTDEIHPLREVLAQHRHQTYIACLITCFICSALSFAAINRAGEDQSNTMTALCKSDLALTTLARDPAHQADLHGVTRGMSPDGVRRLPQCRERQP